MNMNWTPEMVKTEMEYRAERAAGLRPDSRMLEHRRALRAGRPSRWWRRSGGATTPTPVWSSGGHHVDGAPHAA